MTTQREVRSVYAAWRRANPIEGLESIGRDDPRFEQALEQALVCGITPMPGDIPTCKLPRGHDGPHDNAARFEKTTTMCQSWLHPRPAIIGPHRHWNGEHYTTCLDAESCPTPSCHPADSESDQWAIICAFADDEEGMRARYGGHEPLPAFLLLHPDTTTADLGPGHLRPSGTCHLSCEPCWAMRPAEPLPLGGPMPVEALRRIVGWAPTP